MQFSLEKLLILKKFTPPYPVNICIHEKGCPCSSQLTLPACRCVTRCCDPAFFTVLWKKVPGVV